MATVMDVEPVSERLAKIGAEALAPFPVPPPSMRS